VENVPRKVIRITHVRLWDGRLLALGPLALTITEKIGAGKIERIILAAAGVTAGHQTILGANGRMTIHTTYHATDVHDTWFAASLGDVATLAPLRARFDQMCRRIFVPAQLQLWGVNHLFPLPVEPGAIKLIPGPEPESYTIDASAFRPLPIEVAGTAPIGSMWAGVSVAGTLKGLVLVAHVEGIPTIAFVPDDECEDLSRQFIGTLAGPTGRILPRDD
jgi:hypothetical protein